MATSVTNPYAYSEGPHVRRHGPAGYSDYNSYRQWLEDEFVFRCIYCLKRKVWAPTDIWAIDHLISQDENPKLATEYDNLVFACQFCNLMKGPNRVPDPCSVAYGQCLRIESDGTVTPLNKRGQRLVKVIRLNHPRFVEERKKNIRNLAVLESHDSAAFEAMMGFPSDLPDLSLLKPPKGNSRSEGVNESWFAKRSRGKLPRTY